jgi:hypothetical protein
VGTVAWTNPGNVTADDNVVTTASLTSTNTTSHYLKATNYFSGTPVPSDATVLGITVEVDRRNSGGGNCKDNVVSLVLGGTVSGDNKAAAGNWPTTALTYATYGSASDLWGLTLTPADVNATDFGVALSAIRVGSSPVANVDHIRVTVAYAAAVGGVAGTAGLTGSAT